MDYMIKCKCGNIAIKGKNCEKCGLFHSKMSWSIRAVDAVHEHVIQHLVKGDSPSNLFTRSTKVQLYLSNRINKLLIK